MKKFMTHAAIIAAIFSTLLSGCIRDSNIAGRRTTGVAVKFSTSTIATRAYNNMWEPGDRIGIYMLPAASASSTDEPDWSEPAAAPLAANRLYAHDMASDAESALFAGVGDENIIVWPGGGRAVDFVAYYPWRPSDELAGFVYPVDISDQSVQSGIDLMYSNNAKGVTGGNPALSFEHKLTKVVFNITDLDGLPLDGMKATVVGLPTKAGFSFETGRIVPDPEAPAEPFDALVASTFDGDPADPDDDDGTRESAVVEAMVIPGEEVEYSVTFTLANGDKAVFNVANPEYEAGKRYIYDIVLSSEPGEKIVFGGDGTHNTIVGWIDVREDGEPHDIRKNDDGTDEPPFVGERGETWNSGPLVADPEESAYSATGVFEADESGYKLEDSEEIRIMKSNYQGGVASVTLDFKLNNSRVQIKSVKVGDENLVYENGETDVTIHDDSDTETPYTFNTATEGLASGEIEIVVEKEDSPRRAYMTGFTIN
jgi:hypothetical protein